MEIISLTSREVKLNAATVTPMRFAVEDAIDDPSSFEVALPEKVAGLDLADSAEFRRNDILQLTGGVESLEESFTPEQGYTCLVEGRDNLRKLAARTTWKELFLRCEPADIVRYLNRPGKRVSEYEFNLFRELKEAAAFYYDFQSGGSGSNYYHWQYVEEGYRSWIRTPYVEAETPTFYNFVNHDTSKVYSLENYIVTSNFKIDVYLGAVLYKSGRRKSGILLQYKDQNNWLALHIYLNWVYSYASGGYWWCKADVYGYVDQCVSGVVTQIDAALIASQVYRYDLGFHLQMPVILHARIVGNNVWARFETTGTFTNTVTLSGTFNNVLLGEARIGIYSYSYTAGVASNGWCAWKTLRVIAGSTPSVSVGTSSDVVGLTDIDERTFWTSGTNQVADQWVKVDLGSIKSVCAIKVQQDLSKYARNFKIQYSETDVEEDYEDLKTYTDSEQSTILHSFNPVSARYVRLLITENYASHWQINEIYVREADDGNPLMEEGTIEDYGDVVTFRTNFEPRLDTLRRLADFIGYYVYSGKDGKLNFAATRGEDKSATVIFETGVNICDIEREKSLLDPGFAGIYTLLGQGLGSQLIPNTFTYIPVDLPLEIKDIEKIVDFPSTLSGLTGESFGWGYWSGSEYVRW
jgi:hypothetical protein